MNAGILYIMRFWLNPVGGERALQWLDGGHLAEVMTLPGFLWVRRCRLEQTNAAGWTGYEMVFGLDSMASLNAYFHSDAIQRFAKEREAAGVNEVVELERHWGEVDFSLDAAGAQL